MGRENKREKNDWLKMKESRTAKGKKEVKCMSKTRTRTIFTSSKL